MLLQKNQQEKLQVLYALCKGAATTQALAEALQIPRRRIKETIKKINLDVETLCEYASFIVLDLQGNAEVQPVYTSQVFFVFSRLKFSYLQQNNEFQVVMLVFSDQKLTIPKLAKRLFLSESYTRRLIKMINQKLVRFQFQISETPEKWLDFDGNELAIRLFLYFLLHDLDPIFDAMPSEEDEAFLPRFEIEHDYLALYALTRILSKRSTDIHPMPVPETAIYPIMQQIQDSFDILAALSNSIAFASDFQTHSTEKLYLSLFSHIFLADLIPDDVKIRLGNTLAHSAEPFLHFAEALTEAAWLELSLRPDEAEQAITRYYFVLLAVYFLLTKDAFDHLLDLVIPRPNYNLLLENEKNTRLTHFFQQFLAKQPEDSYVVAVRENPLLQQYYISILYTVLESETFPQVNLYIAASKDFTAKSFLIKRLLKIYNPELIHFCEHPQESELVITDRLHPVEEHTTVFFLDTLMDKTHWKRLLDTIEQILLEKLFK